MRETVQDVVAPSGKNARPSWALLAGLWISVLIAIAAVIRRVIALSFPSSTAPAATAALDAVFATHRALTLAHILPAAAFVVLAPIALLKPDAHWPQRFVYPLGAIVGITAYAMSAYAVGGWIEQAAVLLFNSLFLYWLCRAYLQARGGEAMRGQQSLIRAVAILLGIATARPIMGIFFATSHATGLGPRQFFGIAFWLGFSINTLAVEWWLTSQSSGRRLPPAVE